MAFSHAHIKIHWRQTDRVEDLDDAAGLSGDNGEERGEQTVDNVGRGAGEAALLDDGVLGDGGRGLERCGWGQCRTS